MATEQHRVVIGLEFSPGQAVANAIQAEERIRGVFQKLNNESIRVGGLDRSAAERFGQDLRQSIQSAMQVDVRNSPLFQSMRQLDQKLVRGTTETDPSRFLSERLRLTEAELARERIQQRSRVPLGKTSQAGIVGFSSEADRSQAQIRAARGVENANRALETAYRRYATEIATELTRHRRDARAEEDARARATNAINRRTDAERAASQRALDAINKVHYRRIQAEDKLARVLEQQAATEAKRAADAAQADVDAGAFRTTYANPNVNTPVGRGQSTVNRAEASLELATRALATTRASETRTADQLIAGERRVQAASSALAAARERLATIEAATGVHTAGSLRQQFMTGFHGRNQDRGYAEQMGQAFKFSLFYGTAYKLLFALTQTFQQTLQEGIEFQQALSDLKLATGMAEDSASDLANSLGESATAAGFAPSEGVKIGARAVGLYGATNAPAERQTQIAEDAARVVTRLAFASGMQAADLQTNVAAVGQAFGQGPAGQFRIADIDAYMAKEFGVVPGETIQAVSEAGNVAAAAGYNMEEVSAIAALLQGRTGQTPAAVAGYMAQIFSRGGEGTLGNVTRRYGIDPSLELSEQIRQLSEVYRNASGPEQAQIASAFGRGKVQNAVVTLLTGLDDVDKVARNARTEAPGALDRTVDEKLSNIGGQIQLTVAAMQAFAKELGDAGVLAVLGAGVLLLRELTEASTNLLRLWNQLDGPMKAAIAGLIAFAVAAQKGAFSAALSAGGVGVFRSAGGAYGAGTSITAGRLAVANAAGAAAPLASRAGVGMAMGAAASLGPAAAIAAAIGGLWAIGELSGSSRELGAAQDKATKVLRDSGGLVPGVSTSEDYRTRASALKDAALESRDSADGWAASLVNMGADKDQAIATAERLEAESARLNRVAARAEARESIAPERAAVSGFDPDNLTASMDAITASGGTARERLDALQAALYGTADAANRAEEAFAPKQFAGEQAANVLSQITGQKDARVLQSSPSLGDVAKGLLTYTGTGPLIEDREYKDITADLIEKAITQGDVQQRLHSQIKSLSSLGEIDKETAQGIAENVVGDAADALGADAGLGGTLTEEEVGVAREAMVRNVRRYLLAQTRGVRKVLSGHGRLTQVELDAVVARFTADAQEVIDALPETDYTGRVGEAQQLVRNLRRSIRRADGGGTPQAFAALGQAERAVAQAEFTRLEQLRKVAQQNAGSRAEVARVGRSFLRRELRAAIRGGNQDLLATIVAQAGNGAITIARQMIEEALKVARTAQQIRARILATIPMIGQVAAMVTSVMPADSGMQDMLDSLDTTLTAGSREDNVYLSGSDVPGYKPPESAAEKAKKDRETAMERAAARAAAQAARSESPIAAARAEMMGARAAMAEAKKGTVEYYNALSSYYSARNQLTDAILDYRNTQYLLGIDNTDPLAQAQAALRAARAKLRSDKGKGADVRAQDRLAVQEAEANREATAFQQRLDAVQTAEQLGRISHAKYLDYLNKESRRLNRIKDRTFQQQQQLDQIDMLLKEAAGAMDAQWNFGDIKLPTPYQVRRQIEEANRGRELAQSVAQTIATTNIRIDGADTGAVTRIIERYVGKYGRTMATAHRHR